MNILDDKKVREFFGCFKKEGEVHEHRYVDECVAQRSKHILDAMQQPIKKGERYLDYTNGVLTEKMSEFDHTGYGPYHPFELRLPDRFQPTASQVQKKECRSHWCEGCNGFLPHRNDPGQPQSEQRVERSDTPAPEEKICECYPNHSYQPSPTDGCSTHCPCDCHSTVQNCCKTPKPETSSQAQECGMGHLSEECRCAQPDSADVPSSRVEEKIKFLAERYGDMYMTPIETHLRELVKLARNKE